MNYRRFFTVNGLICLNIQDEHVFEVYHQLIKQLVDEGIFQGLRIDHIDGLYDPSGYLHRLRKLAGEETYIVVEKILEQEETVPEHWPIEGSTGYDFLAIVNNVLSNSASEKYFRQFYISLSKTYSTVPQQIRDKKAHILYEHMAGELENLYRLFIESNLLTLETIQSVAAEEMKRAIGTFLIHCPVYRYYAQSLPLIEEAPLIRQILDQVKQAEPDLSHAIGLLEDVWLIKPETEDEGYKLRAVHFYKRCMQFSGPLMAKGVEDTLMYNWNAFIAHNEVGDAPDAFGLSTAQFHEKMRIRQQQSPLALNATSTHDTKRGEDVRARLNVLTDIPDLWFSNVGEWMHINKRLKKNGMPDANDEYFIYQTLIGTWPLIKEEEKDFGDRLGAYFEKALREGKHHSNWSTPDTEYEQAVKDFTAELLKKGTPFQKSFQRLLQHINDAAIVHSLHQVLLKFTCPGTPDVYQGCELWDFSLVDPDNRRPVDYQKRIVYLEQITNSKNNDIHRELWSNRNDGRIKFWLTYSLMQIRKSNPEIFAYGDYVPLEVTGMYKDNVLAYARKLKRTWYIIAIPLHISSLFEHEKKDLSNFDWKDTTIQLPKAVKNEWTNLLFESSGVADKNKLLLDGLFKELPFFIGRMEGTINERGAGVLLHITSLASNFGIGDMGPQAKAFADILHRGKQKYWQLLPINPTEGGQGHSPYSATSSMAGNILMISPEVLANEGLLSNEALPGKHLPFTGKTLYEETAEVKMELLQMAWQNFNQQQGSTLQKAFIDFCQDEKQWLDDFANYALLKQQHQGKPWYEWPKEYKSRSKETISKWKAENDQELQYIKWLQFVFYKQWNELKKYCNQRNIELIGDLPFYISYDSADVWTHQDIFNLDAEGNRLGLAGVPPDAFSADGQLWGMPVFRWDVLKQRNYSWWVDRLRKQTELFDKVRLDHFRAFAAYWEVPAGEETARNGQWKTGPGVDFFKVLKEAFGELPFIAEDLGDIDDAVMSLRDDFQLPGMKILQFAFGDDDGVSDYLPHNYDRNFIVYTGTHDNNTSRGWYRQEANTKTKKRIDAYTGRQLSEDDIPPLLCRMAYASVAEIAILPLQDILGLDEIARMNIPASGTDNWAWRLLPGQVSKHTADTLRHWTKIYNRR
ncbi:MAG TPA: malto-oligosyltrehalose synthase [Flavisolibacter sp.]|nr:malto-oligosyltrehalose synthase [Flavisolibacter sp.]